MTETITVYFKPVLTISSVTVYHENLVYTNNAGQSFLTSAFASNQKAAEMGQKIPRASDNFAAIK